MVTHTVTQLAFLKSSIAIRTTMWLNATDLTSSYEKHIQQCCHNVLTLNCPVFIGLIMVMRTKVTGVMANVVVMAV